jgi:hypothetical protein
MLRLAFSSPGYRSQSRPKRGDLRSRSLPTGRVVVPKFVRGKSDLRSFFSRRRAADLEFLASFEGIRLARNKADASVHITRIIASNCNSLFALARKKWLGRRYGDRYEVRPDSIRKEVPLGLPAGSQHVNYIRRSAPSTDLDTQEIISRDHCALRLRNLGRKMEKHGCALIKLIFFSGRNLKVISLEISGIAPVESIRIKDWVICCVARSSVGSGIGKQGLVNLYIFLAENDWIPGFVMDLDV